VGQTAAFYRLRPTRLARFVARLVLNTRLGDSHWFCGAHYWAIRRLPRLFHWRQPVAVRDRE
jgi:hypothetical protein